LKEEYTVVNVEVLDLCGGSRRSNWRQSIRSTRTTSICRMHSGLLRTTNLRKRSKVRFLTF